MPESRADAAPAVSIILPTYNRAKFLPQAFASIRSQTFTDWELIVVDDGSTDETAAAVAEQTRGWTQPVRYHRQENQGAYGARNTGLDLARGEYVAFFDSDDVWLPHHLADCAAALAANPDVDWVYGACQMVDCATGQEVSPSTFYHAGRPRELLRLRARAAGRLRIIEDPRVVACAVRAGLYSGLQNSVIRRSVFAGRRFDTRHRNEGEDVLFEVRALAAGHRFGYFDNVHVVYHMHDANSSAAGTGPVQKRVDVLLGIAKGLENTRQELPLPPGDRRAVVAALAETYFWKIGYALLWQNGRRAEALDMFRTGLRLRPAHLGFWKTYLLARVRYGRVNSPAGPAALNRTRQ